MPQSHSKQKPTSPSTTRVLSDKDSGEGLWMKGNITADYKQRPFEETSSTSPHAGQSIPSTEQSATVACDIAGNDDVSRIPWIHCYPDDADKSRNFATSTGVPGIQVYPLGVFSHASDSHVSDAVDASQKSDEPRADMETQTSPGGVADVEIESQTPVRTPHLTGVSDSNAVTDLMNSWDTTKDVPVSSGFCNWKEGSLLESGIEGSMSPSSDGVPRAKAEQQNREQSKMRQSGAGTMGGSEKLPAGSAPETQNAKPGDVKVHAHSVNASNNPEVLGCGEIAQYFNSSNFPAEWGTEEGVDVESLLGNVNSLDRMEVSEAYAPFSSDRDGLLQDNASSTVLETGSCKFGQLFVHQIGTSLNDLFDQTKDCGGMDASHGLPPWTKNSSGVTGGPSAKDTIYSNKERLSTSSLQLSGLRPTPSPHEDLNLSQRVSLGAVGYAVRAGDYALPDVKPAMQVGSVAVAEKDRNKPMDNAEKRDTGAGFSLKDSTHEITTEDRITLGLHDGWRGKLSDVNTGLPPMTEESWRELETEQTVRLFASDAPSEVDTGRVTAEASSGVPGIRVYPVDLFLDTASNPQTLQEVDASRTITLTTSIEQVITLSTGAAENSKLQTEIKAILPRNAGNTNTVSCLTPMSITSCDNRATSIQSKTQIGLSQLRPLSMNADGPEKIELPEPYSVFNSYCDDLPQDNTTPTVRGSEAIPDSGNIGQLSIHELNTSLNDSFHQTKANGGTDANNCLPPMSKFVSEHGTEETTANNTQPETGGSSLTTMKVSGASVSKLCTPPSATTDIQVELAVETAESRVDSEANEAPEMCGNDVDFDLNCGTRKITEEDYVNLGLHNLWWAKLSDTATGPPENLRRLENAPKDNPLLVGGAINGHDSEDNVLENKTRIDIGDSKLPANVDSLRSMKDPPSLIHFFGVRGPQESPGDDLPGSSPKWQPPAAEDEPQNVDSAKTPAVTSSDRADESGWVKVDMDTCNLPTQTDTVEVE